MPSESAFFTFAIDGLSSVTRVIRLAGTEGMSRLFEFEIDLTSDDPAIDLEAVIGKPALLTMTTADEPRHVHGIVSKFEETGTGRSQTRYAATLVPTLWTLSIRQDCCIFQEKSTPEIVQQVLEEAGLSSGDDFELRLNGSYDPREYCVQYRESDFAFISRLMEEEGLFYFFEHTDAGHKLVIADDTGAYADIPGNSLIKFRESDSGLQSEEEEVRNLRWSRSLRVGRVELHDWNFEKTDLDLRQELESDAEKNLEHYDYPGRYAEGGLGSARSNVRLESMRAERNLLTGESNCRRFTPGFKFAVDEHPRDELNADFLLVRVRHEGDQKQAADLEASGGGGEGGSVTYRNTFEAIPAGVLFRAPQVTPKGLIEGPQTAIVTGPSGEEIHCDSHGRVKVHFHWDRVGAADDKSSCWVRVSQGWAGGSYGAIIIPRIGHEVVVDFLEGDPDRPLIIGRVYNGSNLHGYDLPGEKTKTSLRTNSSPGGGGFNELRFEDASGSEEIFLHGQKDWNTLILNDRTTEIGHDQKAKIGNDKTIEVVANHAEKIGGNMQLKVAGNETEKIDGNRSIEVGGNHQERIKGAMGLTVGETGSISIGGDGSVSVGGKGTVNVGGDLQESAGGKMSVSSGGNYSLSAGANGSMSTAKKLSVEVGDVMSLTVAKDATESIGKKLKITVKDEHGLEAKKITLEAKDEIVLKTGSASIVLKKNGDISIEGGKINVKGSGDVIVKGSKITQN